MDLTAAGFGSTVTGVLPELRTQAESRMTSRATVRRATGKTPGPNGLDVTAWTDVHIDIPFRLSGSSNGDGGTRTVTVGGVQYQQATGVGHMPAATFDLKDNDLIDITAGEWAGSVFRIVDATKKDQATARRVPVVEVTRPAEWA